MKRAGRRCWKWRARSCSRRLACDRFHRIHKDYKPKYDGDLRARDAAYHQGTVWAWLIGPFIDAWLKVHPGDLDERGEVSGWLPAAFERRLHRIHQRNIRCRAAVHAARMHRASLERRRGTALLDQVPSALVAAMRSMRSCPVDLEIRMLRMVARDARRVV